MPEEECAAPMETSPTPNPADPIGGKSGSGPFSPAECSETSQRAQQTFVPGSISESATSADSGLPPAAFGRYEVRRTLGAGSFGTVYLGHDAQLDRPVAIKVLRGGPDVPAGEAGALRQA